MSIKAILFDIDDTIFERRKAQILVAEQIYRRNPDIFKNIDPEKEKEAFITSDRLSDIRYEETKDIRNYRMDRFIIFLDLLGLDQKLAGLITGEYLELYPKTNAAVDDLYTVLIYLKSRYQLGVISNGYREVQIEKLICMGIKELFDCIVICGEDEICKPDKRVFIDACGKLGRKPAECLYVGDSIKKDIIGSKASGMMSCWYNPLYLEMAGEIKPDIEIHRFDELLYVL
jgi:putative hydrolase of the HAD superfamily